MQKGIIEKARKAQDFIDAEIFSLERAVEKLQPSRRVETIKTIDAGRADAEGMNDQFHRLLNEERSKVQKLEDAAKNKDTTITELRNTLALSAARFNSPPTSNRPSIQHNVSPPARQAPLAPNLLLPPPPFAPSNEFESDSYAYMGDDDDFANSAPHSHEQPAPNPTPRVRLLPTPARLIQFGSPIQRYRAPLLSHQP